MHSQLSPFPWRSQILNRTLFPKPFLPTPLFLSCSSASSQPSDEIPSSEPLVSAAVSLLTHHRSKSRWNHLLSLTPAAGFSPQQFSQITMQLRNNPHLALSFFLWTQQRSLCSHSLLSFSTITHVLARARMKGQAQAVIRAAIRAPESDPLKLFESLVKTYKVCGSAPFVFDLLVKSCLESKKIDGCIEIMRMLMSRGISLQVNTLNSLILSVSRCRGAYAGFEIYREVFGLDCEFEVNAKRFVRIKPNVHTFDALMLSFYQDGLIEKIEEIWAEMVNLNCVPNAYSYSVLMAAFCEGGRMREAEKLWEEMRVKKTEPDIVAYNTMISGFCKLGEIGRAEEFFGEMGLSGIESSCVTYEHLINGYCKVGNVDLAIVVYKDMCRKGFRPESKTIEAVIGGLCYNGRVFEGLEILKVAIRDSGFCPTRKSYEFLMTGLCQEGKMEEALKLQAEMVGKGLEPNSKIFNAFIDGYVKQGNEEVAGILRKEMLETQMRQKQD